MKKILRWVGPVMFILFLGLVFYALFRFKDRHPGYEVDLHLRSTGERVVEIGFSKIPITPEGFDTWNDNNGDGRYREKDGDTYNDLNQNGRFDAVWLAGFHQSRPANGVNDPLWARSMVVDDGNIRLALCVIDMIGFGNDEVISTRKRIPSSLNLDYVIISSTHLHSSPDLMGMWGPSPIKRGVDPDYLEMVMEKIVESIEAASNTSRPARLKFARDLTGAEDLVGDSRPPRVLDAGLRLMQAMDFETGETIGTLLNWGNHPETLWSKNVMITSDFPHYYRQYVEEGVYDGDSLIVKGLGGIALYLNGAVGGLMTTRPGDSIVHPVSGRVFEEATFEKADAQGMALALLSIKALSGNEIQETDKASMKVRAKSIALRMDNKLFQLAGIVGVFDRGFVKWKYLRSEVAAWTLGPATFVHVPGELYPEILNGGVKAPEGRDFDIEPIEVPAIREVMGGEFKFFGGMSNDMIGYIIPKSQWDVKAPYAFDLDKRPYGEVNSLGPETAPAIHREVIQLLEDLK